MGKTGTGGKTNEKNQRVYIHANVLRVGIGFLTKYTYPSVASPH